MRATPRTIGLLWWILLAAGLAAPTALAETEEAARLEVRGGVVELAIPDAASWDRATLVVAGREGVVARRLFDAGETPRFDLRGDDGEPLHDGRYAWELVLSTPGTHRLDDGREIVVHAERRRVAGSLRIIDGQPAPERRGAPPAADAGRRPAGVSSSGAAFDDDTLAASERIGVGVAAPESELHIARPEPRVLLDDTASSDRWSLEVRGSGLSVRNDPGEAGQGSRRVLHVEDGARADALYVASSGRLGIGTATPDAALHLASTAAITRYENVLTDVSWDQAVGLDGDFTIGLTNDGEGGAVPGFLRLESERDGQDAVRPGLGIHTAQPTGYLHVRSCTGCPPAPLLKIDGGALPDGIPSQLQILSKDSTLGSASAALTYLDEAAGEAATFEFRTLGGTPFFALNFVGTGGTEFRITKDAEFILGPAGTERFRVDGQGNVTATSFEMASARSLKQDIEPVAPADVLAGVRGLEIARWSYRESSRDRHLGPFAEDFRSAFGIGGAEGRISLGDAAGVSLAAIQGLLLELDERDRRIESLERRLERLETLLERATESR